jgi:hypothetical protein
MTKTFTKIGATLYDNSLWQAPSDRTFRNAWESAGADSGVITVDMDRAKDIWREKIRQARDFVPLDAAFMKALETGADASSVTAQKQLLRDAPADPAIDAATTPEELKAVQPAGLKVD